MLYYLCRQRPVRISYIQRFMKEQGYSVAHSTIIHGYKKAKFNCNSFVLLYTKLSVEVINEIALILVVNIKCLIVSYKIE